MTNKVWSCDSNLLVDMIIGSRFCKSSISMKEVINIREVYFNFLRISSEKSILLVQVQYFRTGTRCDLEILQQNKSLNVFKSREKLAGVFLPHPPLLILKRVNDINHVFSSTMFLNSWWQKSKKSKRIDSTPSALKSRNNKHLS